MPHITDQNFLYVNRPYLRQWSLTWSVCFTTICLVAGVPTHVTVMLSWTLDTRHQMQIFFFLSDRCVHPSSSQGYSCLPAAPYYGLPSGLVLVFNDLNHVSLLRTLQGLDRTTTLFLSFPSIVRDWKPTNRAGGLLDNKDAEWPSYYIWLGCTEGAKCFLRMRLRFFLKMYVPPKSVIVYSNNKPWFSRDIKHCVEPSVSDEQVWY